MSGLQCPFCDEVIEYTDAEGNQSLSQLLGAGVSQAVSEHTEKELRAHLETHSLEDFVSAMVMADRYIAQVEAERDEAVKWRTDVEARIAAGPIMRPAPDPRGDRQARPLQDERLPRAPMPGYEDTPVFVEPQPRGPRRQHVDPNQTLIPVIPTGQRPEGVVGRKHA